MTWSFVESAGAGVGLTACAATGWTTKAPKTASMAIRGTEFRFIVSCLFLAAGKYFCIRFLPRRQIIRIWLRRRSDVRAKRTGWTAACGEASRLESGDIKESDGKSEKVFTTSSESFPRSAKVQSRPFLVVPISLQFVRPIRELAQRGQVSWLAGRELVAAIASEGAFGFRCRTCWTGPPFYRAFAAWSS